MGTVEERVGGNGPEKAPLTIETKDAEHVEN